MTLSDFRKIKDVFDRENIKSNRKLVIYMFFVGLATIFWFLNALSKEYTTTVNYPVSYSDFPSKKILSNELPSRLRLTVRAYGFDLLRYKLSFFQSINFPVNEYTNNRLEKSDENIIRFSTNRMTSAVAAQLSSAISVTHISPDTINFQFSSLIEKKLPVHFNSNLKFEPQFRLGGDVMLKPDSIWVIGAQSIVDSIKQIETETLELKKLNESTKKKLNFVKIEGLKFVEKKVEVELPVEQFTEAQKQVGLKILNLPDSVYMRLFPHQVKVSYLVGLKDYETISEEQFELEIDYGSIDLENNKVKVNLKNSPLNISNVSFYPEEVVYLIEKRN
ncbi:hypothetical protein L3073_18960 [Ancylomarina sp. DW003]|nr:CdaR family protein [Ancylomarina sp. DW003]MDE5424296.1 hypothetical protein [Ancylomarina sp. DW003]